MFARQSLRRVALHPGQEMVMMCLWDLASIIHVRAPE
jgi:hypothetical protein